MERRGRRRKPRIHITAQKSLRRFLSEGNVSGESLREAANLLRPHCVAPFAGENLWGCSGFLYRKLLKWAAVDMSGGDVRLEEHGGERKSRLAKALVGYQFLLAAEREHGDRLEPVLLAQINPSDRFPIFRPTGYGRPTRLFYLFFLFFFFKFFTLRWRSSSGPSPFRIV